MEPKRIFLLFLLLIILCIATGGSDHALDSEEEIYEIDYRGPETHSAIPPPIHHSHGNNQPLIHGQTDAERPLHSKTSPKTITNYGKKVHG